MPDPLLSALEFLGKALGKPVNRATATAGLPLVGGKLTPELFIRAASRQGLACRIVERDLRKLRSGWLPCVLILKENGAAVLTQLGRKTSEIVVPETGDGVQQLPTKELEADYAGFVILVKSEFDFEKRAQHDPVPRSRSWFWGTLWRFRGIYARVAIASLVINCFALTSSLFIMNVYDRVVPNQAFETLYVLATGAAIVFLFDFILKMLRAHFVDRAGQRADIVLGSALFEQILGMKFAAKPASAGAFASQARAYESLREFFTSASMVALVDLPFVLFFALIVYLIGGVLALPLMLGLTLALLIGLLSQGPLSRAVKRGYQAANQRHALVVESISALEMVKGQNAESQLQTRMEDAIRESSAAEISSRGVSAFATNCTMLLQQLVSIGIVILGVYQIKEGNLTMGGMIACVILGGRGMAPLGQVASLFTRLQQSRTALQGLNQIMELPTERSEGKQRVSIEEFKPDIELKDIQLTYPNQPAPALSGLNVEVKAGERVALLGRVGSGKSTLLKLLAGLYEPEQGVVSLSGVELRQFDPSDLRQRIGYVSQQVTLFYGSVLDNLRLGAPWVSDDQVLAAVKAAGVDRFTEGHPDGIQRSVGERGELLSGGQRQAIALARALVTSPSLLLFDEPTSSMDMNSESEFVSALTKYLDENPKTTLLLSTHKPAVLKLVDRIVVLQDGKVAADGPRDQIMGKLSQAKQPAAAVAKKAAAKKKIPKPDPDQ